MDQAGQILRVLNYFPRFKCIGTECEDTCCVAASVFLDQRTLDLYAKEQDPDLRAQLEAATKRMTGTPKSAAAKLKFDPATARCPFFGTDRLCRLHTERGRDFLGYECAEYPREENIIDGFRETALRLSCPEAARVVLLNEDPLTLASIERASSRFDYLYHREIDSQSPSSQQDGRSYFFWIRELIISALQVRAAPFADRFLLVGVFCQQLDRLAADGRGAEIPSTLEAFGKQLAPSSALFEAMRQVSANSAVQYELLRAISGRYFTGLSHLRFTECVRDATLGLEGTVDRGEAYAKAAADHYLTFEPLQRYILENWCVNEVFRTVFPFGRQVSIFDNYAILALKVAMVKFYLVGLAAAEKGLSEALVVKVIQSFSRAVESCPPFEADVLALLESKQIKTLPALAILVKN